MFCVVRGQDFAAACVEKHNHVCYSLSARGLSFWHHNVIQDGMWKKRPINSRSSQRPTFLLVPIGVFVPEVAQIFFKGNLKSV